MILKSTVHQHLTQAMKWKLQHFKGIRDSLTEFEKMNRLQRTTKLWEFLQLIRYQEWQDIVTIDESWFCWEIDWEQQWLPEDNKPGTRTRP
jgi:hypothetical protein